MLSVSFAVVFFLLTILLVTQVTAHLLARSRLAADADHAARVVASAANGRDLADAIDQQRQWLLRQHGYQIDVSIDIDADGVVIVDLTASSPAQMAGAIADVLGIDEVHATARVRSERLR